MQHPRFCEQLRRLLCAILSAAVTAAMCACGGGGAQGTQPISGSVSATAHPLVAKYSAQIPASSSAFVEFGKDQTYGRKTSSQVPNSAGTVEILVAGMQPATTYHMRVVTTGRNGTQVDSDHTFTTGQPDAASVPITTVKRSGSPAPGVELLDMVVPNGKLQAAVVDLDGTLVWYYAYDPAMGFPYPIRPMPGGHMLITIGTRLMREIDLAGTTIRELTPDVLNQRLEAASRPERITGFHHDALPLPNGHVVVICEQQKMVTLAGDSSPRMIRGDALIDLDGNFNPVWTWSAFDHLDVNRHPMDVEDWLHSNGLLYSPTDHALILSIRNQHWVLKIDYADGQGSGAVLWRLGPGGDFHLSDDPLDWFYGQHFPSFADNQNGNLNLSLAVFDNRATNQDGTTCATTTGTCYSRPLILKLDETTMTASIQWQDDLSLYSLWGGSIQTLSNGNVEFDVPNPFPGLQSRIMEVSRDSKQTVWQMDIQGQLAYRGYRIPSLYPGVQW